MVLTAQINAYNFLLSEYVKQKAKKTQEETIRNICDWRQKQIFEKQVNVNVFCNENILERYSRVFLGEILWV